MPWPASAATTKKARFPGGGTGIFRLHAGGVRVLYEVDHDTSTVYIINVGRIS